MTSERHVGVQASLSSCQDRIELLLNNNVQRESSACPAATSLTGPQTPSTATSKLPCCPALPSTPT